MATINGVETNESFLEGTEQNDSIFGGMGDETVDGKGGSDLMDASGGKNILTGGTGADYFCVGAGDDTITDYAAEDSIFTEERGSGETRDINGITLSGNDVVIAIKDTWTHGSSNNRVTVQNAANKTITFVRNDYYNGNNQFGGYTMSKTTLTLRKDFGGDARAKADWGNAWRTLDARHYLPTITTIDGSAATKTTILYGNGNANTITGGSNNDALYGLDGNDTLRGGKGNDYLDGGVGNDVLHGGTGNDTFVYKVSTGKDTIGDYTAGELLSITGGTVTKAAVSGSNVVFTVGKGAVTLKNVAAKTISMKDSRGSYTMSKTGLTLLSNFTGTMDAAQYLSTVKTINGKSATKTLKLYGNAQSNTITGGKAADYLNGGAGNDTLTGGASKDTFVYKASTGKDTITDYASGDLLSITGGTIAKTVLTNKNKDLLFTVGRGTVTMKNAATKSIAMKDNRGNYTMTKSGLSLSSNFKGALNAANYLSTITSINGKNAGKTVTLYGNAKNNTINGGKAADKLYGRVGNDKLYGNAGNDYLYGEMGNDYLNGGAGNDTLTGGKGNDTFVYRMGEGNDVITDYQAGDVLNIASGEITNVKFNGNNVLINVGQYGSSKGSVLLKGAANKTIVIKDVNGSYVATKTGVKLKSGTGGYYGFTIPSTWKTIDLSVATKGVTVVGNNLANTISSGKGSDSLYGGGGNDTLTGGKGNDTLCGGKGNDYLTGGAGKDVFVFRAGEGNDVVVDYQEGDVLYLASGYVRNVSLKNNEKDVFFELSSGSVLLTGAGGKILSGTDGHYFYTWNTNFPLSTGMSGFGNTSAMLAGSAEAQLSSLVSTATAGSLGALTTPDTGLASVDASGSSLVAANGVDSSNALTNKNKVL